MNFDAIDYQQNILNSNGPNTEPWGTPAVTYKESEKWTLALTDWYIFDINWQVYFLRDRGQFYRIPCLNLRKLTTNKVDISQHMKHLMTQPHPILKNS